MVVVVVLICIHAHLSVFVDCDKLDRRLFHLRKKRRHKGGEKRLSGKQG